MVELLSIPGRRSSMVVNRSIDNDHWFEGFFSDFLLLVIFRFFPRMPT